MLWGLGYFYEALRLVHENGQTIMATFQNASRPKRAIGLWQPHTGAPIPVNPGKDNASQSGFSFQLFCYAIRFFSSFHLVQASLPWKTFALNILILRAMKFSIWIWILLWCFHIYASVRSPGQHATQTTQRHFLPSEPTRQQLAQITLPPKANGATIQPRADIPTCAYVSGDTGR